MSLHPQVRAMLDQIEESGLPQLYELSPVDARAQAKLMAELVGAGPEVARVSEFSIPTSAGQIPARRYVPTDAAGVILWIHGGGWVICDLDTHDAMCRLLANESGCEVVAIEYRLAPEHPFPAPLEDCWDALRWVAEQAGEQPVIVAGDSAGGNMAAVCALRARDRGGPELALQVLVYPAASGDLTTKSCAKYGSGPDTFLTVAEMEWFWAHYVGDAADDSSPEFRPLRAQDHSGLPPAASRRGQGTSPGLRAERMALGRGLVAGGSSGPEPHGLAHAGDAVKTGSRARWRPYSQAWSNSATGGRRPCLDRL